MGLFNGLTMESVLAFILFIAILLGVNEITRRSKVMSILTYCVLPAVLAVMVLLGVLGSPTGKTWFGWVKVVSALAGVWGFMAIRFTKLGERRFASLFPVTILSLNIAEAVYREFEVFATYQTLQVDAAGVIIQGGMWNILNGISGIICIVTLVGFSGIRVSKDKSRDMVWPDMTWMYIVAYTLWNYAYVLNCISTRSVYAGLGILIAALLAEFVFKKGVWLQHRAQILSFYAMFSLTVDYQSVSFFQVYPVYETWHLMGVSVAAFIFNIAFFGYMVYTIVVTKKNPLKEELYAHTAYHQRSLEVNNLLADKAS